MEVIEVQTLVDVTRTKAIRPNQGSPLEHNQYRNFMTLRQCIEIRSIIDYDTPPSVETVDLTGLGFGSAYTGKHRVWTFRFKPDRVGVYVSEDGNRVGSLLEDLDSVPVIKNLSETVNISKAIFSCKDSAFKNITVRVVEDSI